MERGSDSKVLSQANTVARVLNSNADVAVLTPASAPRVTDNPVLLAGVADTPTDHVDGVIDAGGAAVGVKDTTLVLHEVVVASGDSNRDRVLLKLSLPLSGGPALLDAGVALGLNASVSNLAATACTFFGSVGIFVFGNHTVGVSIIVESIGHETTIAAIVASGSAVNKLLLREVLILSGLDIVEGLELRDGSESPA